MLACSSCLKLLTSKLYFKYAELESDLSPAKYNLSILGITA